jgi:hypothetical protein
MEEKAYAEFSAGLISANTEQTVSIGFRLSAR